MERQRLLERLVFAHFGHATGEVASLLLHRGALSLPQLQRLCSLAPSALYAALLTLSLHGCLYHAEDEQNGRLVEVYDLHTHALEDRLRGARWAAFCKTGHARSTSKGDDNARAWLARQIWSGGAQRASTLAEKLAQWQRAESEMRAVTNGLDKVEIEDDDVKPETSANGAATTTTTTTSKSKQQQQRTAYDRETDMLSDDQLVARALALVRDMHKHRLFSVVTAGSRRSPLSLELKWHDELRQGIKNVPTAKDLREMHAKLATRRREYERTEQHAARGLLGSGPGAGAAVRRHSNANGAPSSSRPKKRRKVTEDDSASEDDEEQEDEDDDGDDDGGAYRFNAHAFYQLNHEQFRIKWRSRLVREHVDRRFGPMAGRVIDAALTLVEPTVDALSDELSQEFTIHQLVPLLDEVHPSKMRAVFAKDAKFPGYDDDEKGTPPPMPVLVLELLKILASEDDPSLFSRAQNAVIEKAGSQTGRYRFNWRELGEQLQRARLESIIRRKTTFKKGKDGKEQGRRALRVWRILEAKGKLDEKHLARLAFLPPKDVREAIALLSQAALIDCQEVPRDAARSVSRIFYLWYVDLAAVLERTCAHVYKALANVEARKEEQTLRARAVIDKRERKDVKDNADELLTGHDHAELHSYDEMMISLSTAQLRIDEDLFILRDLA